MNLFSEIFPWNLVQISLSNPELLTFVWNSRSQRPPSWIFSLCVFGHSDVLIVWYLCSVPNLVQIYVIVTEIDTHTSDNHLMTSRELTSSFNFCHVVISASPWCIFPYNLMQDIFIQSKVIDIFPKFKMAAATIWIFRLCEFGHSGVLIVLYLCSVPTLVQISVIVTEIDTDTSDNHLMTSRQLTSGFDLWSRGHLCVAVLHLPI